MAAALAAVSTTVLAVAVAVAAGAGRARGKDHLGNDDGAVQLFQRTVRRTPRAAVITVVTMTAGIIVVPNAAVAV